MHLVMHRHHRVEPGDSGHMGDGASPPLPHPQKLRGR
jgi:hypothetical protein